MRDPGGKGVGNLVRGVARRNRLKLTPARQSPRGVVNHPLSAGRPPIGSDESFYLGLSRNVVIVHRKRTNIDSIDGQATCGKICPKSAKDVVNRTY